MKKLLFLYALYMMLPLSARIGCYEKGRYEEPQFVECLCDCAHTHPTCMWCGHYHEAPYRQIIATVPLQKNLTTLKKNIPVKN